jgi:serine protease Do
MARPKRAVPLTRSHSLLSRLAGAAIGPILGAAMVLTPLAIPAYAENLGQGGKPMPQLSVDNSPLPRTQSVVTSYAPIVEKVSPTIVTIYTTKEIKADPNAPEGNQLLRRFFGIPDNSDEGDGGAGGKVEGLGSGVIITPDGLILTNNHVAEAGDQIMVRIGDHNKEYKAKVVGNDPSSDLALIRIDAKNLPVATFADSDQVKVGDVVLAIGNPFALTDTVTHGIVSALGRGGMGITDYEDFIQTDASINPGNSGGALVDAEGRLIGINTAIFSRSGGNQGIGFAVPSNLARQVVDSLLKYGKVTRGYLGTVVQSLTPDLADQFKVPEDQQGALISEVAPDGAAAKAGLKSGDIITAVNGKAIADPHQLRLSVGGMSPGDKVSVSYLRDAKPQTVEVTLGEQSANGEIASNNTPEGKSNVLDGIAVGDLDNAARQQYKVPADIKGVLVTDVAQDSVGYEEGLRKGDVIMEMNRKPMTNANQAINDSNTIEKTEKVLLHVWSNGRTEFLVLKPQEG